MCFSGHDERTPSLSFWVEKNSWKCFGCGLGGSPIDLVCQVLGYSNPLDAAKWIHQRFGLGAKISRKDQKTKTSGQVSAALKYRPSRQAAEPPNPPDVEVYKWLIERCPLGDFGYRYLREKRGLSKRTITQFRVCELRDPRRAFAALVKRWGVHRILRSGLGRENKYAKNVTDAHCLIWFRHALLFPFNSQGNVEYIQARLFADRAPKYIGLLGQKKPMYNIDELRKAPKKSDVYICEGVTDTLAAHELGLRAVGVLGASSFRNDWVPMFDDVNPLVVPDNDAAGDGFRKSVQHAFALQGRVVNSVTIGQHNDLSDVVLDNALARKSRTS